MKPWFDCAKVWFSPFERPTSLKHKAIAHATFKTATSTAGAVPWAFLLILFITVSCETPVTGDSTKATMIKNGVRLQVVVPHVIHSREPAKLTVTLSNESSKVIYFSRIDGLQELHLRVVRPDQSLPVMTPLGTRAKIWAEAKSHSSNSIPLQPGQVYDWNVNLSDYYEFQPGTFFASVSIEVNRFSRPFIVSLNDLKVAVR